MYDADPLGAAWEIARGWDAATREGLRVAASEAGLAGSAGGVSLRDVAARALDLSRAGLIARGLGEEVHLAPLQAIIASGRTRADDLLAAYAGEWGGDIGRVYEACRL
jgi:glutamate--cysteine ligase